MVLTATAVSSFAGENRGTKDRARRAQRPRLCPTAIRGVRVESPLSHLQPGVPTPWSPCAVENANRSAREMKNPAAACTIAKWPCFHTLKCRHLRIQAEENPARSSTDFFGLLIVGRARIATFACGTQCFQSVRCPRWRSTNQTLRPRALISARLHRQPELETGSADVPTAAKALVAEETLRSDRHKSACSLC